MKDRNKPARRYCARGREMKFCTLASFYQCFIRKQESIYLALVTYLKNIRLVRRNNFLKY